MAPDVNVGSHQLASGVTGETRFQRSCWQYAFAICKFEDFQKGFNR